MSLSAFFGFAPSVLTRPTLFWRDPLQQWLVHRFFVLPRVRMEAIFCSSVLHMLYV